MRVTRFDEAACGRIGEARFEAIERIRVEADAHDVDFIVIAGDLFDDHSVSAHVAERAFTLFEGTAIRCPVYVIPGNHDPLTPGGVWDREPWGRRDRSPKHLRLLRTPEPVAVEISGRPVTLFPCPLRYRRSVEDPTRWIADHPRIDGDPAIRIGLAHGSLDILPNLPLDDHLIDPHAAERLGLDYLALGHWHRSLDHRSADGAIRAAYSGTHEPMRFPDRGAGVSTGWVSCSGEADAERFQDDGRGTARLITIAGPGAPPEVTTLAVGRLRWIAADRDVTGRPLGELFHEFAEREDRALTLLRLRLFGVVTPETHRRIESVFRPIIENRYCPGSCLLADEVRIEPSPGELDALVGEGVTARVLERLRDEAASADPHVKRVAEHALKLFYQIVSEERAG